LLFFVLIVEDSACNTVTLQQERSNYFFLLARHISRLNQNVADLQEILSAFGVLWYWLTQDEKALCMFVIHFFKISHLRF